MALWRASIILLLVSPLATGNAITYWYLRNDNRILHIRCSADILPPKCKTSLITILNCTTKDKSPKMLAWADDGKPTKASPSNNMFLDMRVREDNVLGHLDILMTEYDPSVDQRFCCNISYSMSGQSLQMSWNTTVTKVASHENDECSDQKTAIIALATVIALLLIIFMPIVILLCRRQSRRVKTKLGNENNFLNIVPPSYTTAWSDIHPQEPIYQQEPAYSISNMNRSQNNLYKTKSQQSSLQRSNSRQDGRILCSSRPSLPPPIPPAMEPKKDATLTRTSSLTSNRSRIPYWQPQDAIGQMIRENEEVPDNDVSSDGVNVDFQYATPRQDEKRLSCSL